MWIYLHLERTGEVRDDDPTEEYQEKKVYKKKKMDDMNE